MKFRTPYALSDRTLLHGLLTDAGFGQIHIEAVRKHFAGIEARQLATGQIRGTPRSALIAQKGMDLDVVIDKVAAGLKRAGGDPYSGHAQGLVVQARAV